MSIYNRRSTRLARHHHFWIDKLAPFDHHFVVENDGAIPHRRIVVHTRRSLSANLRSVARRKQEISGEGTVRRAAPFGFVTVKRDPVPGRLRIEAPAQMR